MSILTKANNPDAVRIMDNIKIKIAEIDTALVKAEIQKVNPSLSGLKQFIGLDKWTFDGRPIVAIPTQDTWEGEADEDGLPKDANTSLRLLEEQKSKCYQLWNKMLEDGLFNKGGPSESKPDPDPEPESIDMAEVARKQKEKESSKAIDEVVDDKSEPDPEPEPAPKAKPEPESHDKPHPVITLREAIEDIARGVVGPASDSDLQERIDRIEAKLDKLIEFQRVAEPKLSLLEKMKGMFS